MITVALVVALIAMALIWKKKKRKKEKELVSSMINVDKIVPCDYRCSMARMTGYFAYGSETLARAHVLRLEPNYI